MDRGRNLVKYHRFDFSFHSNLEGTDMARTPRMDQIEALLAEDPKDAFLWYGLGMEHAGQGDDAAAVEVFRKLIALNPDAPYVPAFLQAGQALTRLGRDQDAVVIFKDGIEAARKAGDDHALSEMQGFLATIE
jgi:predicted Zn-dependent protease